MEEINHSFDTLKDTWKPKFTENQDTLFVAKLNAPIDVISIELLIEQLMDELINDQVTHMPKKFKGGYEIDLEKINEIINTIMKSL
jgi:hypothetical protein